MITGSFQCLALGLYGVDATIEYLCRCGNPASQLNHKKLFMATKLEAFRLMRSRLWANLNHQIPVCSKIAATASCLPRVRPM